MSKFYVNDLESIKNGKLVRLNFKEKEYGKNELTLLRLNSQIDDLRSIRSCILENFRNDCNMTLDRLKGDKIESNTKIDFDPKLLFLSNYLFLTVPTIMGDINCLLSEKGLENTTFDSDELRNKIDMLLPYIKNLYNVKNNSNVLDNAFYENTKLYNNEYEHVLSINGDGIVLPFKTYFDLDDNEKQDLLAYYYSNWDKILRNIVVNENEILDKYRTNLNKDKVLNYYKAK